MNERKHEVNDLTHHYLNAQEAHTLASNLERIEMEREHIKNPTDIDYCLYMILGVFALLIICLGVWELLRCANNFFMVAICILGGIGAVGLDLWYIRVCWYLLTGK